jgi:hypothetical protein
VRASHHFFKEEARRAIGKMLKKLSYFQNEDEYAKLITYLRDNLDSYFEDISIMDDKFLTICHGDFT